MCDQHVGRFVLHHRDQVTTFESHTCLMFNADLFVLHYPATYKRTIFDIMIVGLVGRVFANDPGDLGSILGRVIPKALKLVLDTSLLNTQQYKVRIKGKVEQSRERSSAPTPWCSSYWKGNLLVALDYSRQIYLQLLGFVHMLAGM